MLELELLVVACTSRGATAESSLKEDLLSSRGAVLALCTSDTSCEQRRQVQLLVSGTNFPLPFVSGTNLQFTLEQIFSSPC